MRDGLLGFRVNWFSGGGFGPAGPVGGEYEMSGGMDRIEKKARLLCEFDGGNPDASLGGDKKNWLWMEYARQACGLIESGWTLIPEKAE